MQEIDYDQLAEAIDRRTSPDLAAADTLAKVAATAANANTPVDWSKMLLFLVVILGLFVLIATDNIDAAAGLGPVGIIVGYLAGNGRTLRKSEL